jgi:hypothetical protein
MGAETILRLFFAVRREKREHAEKFDLFFYYLTSAASRTMMIAFSLDDFVRRDVMPSERLVKNLGDVSRCFVQWKSNEEVSVGAMLQ